MMNKSLKAIACLKVVRGSLILVVGLTLFSIYKHSETLNWLDHPLISSIATRDSLLEVYIGWILEFSQEKVLYIALLAFGISFLRYVEAIGIWLDKDWAEWLAVLTGFIYIPLGINVLVHKFSWLILLLLMINLIVVLYLLYVLWKKRKDQNI